MNQTVLDLCEVTSLIENGDHGRHSQLKMSIYNLSQYGIFPGIAVCYSIC